MVARLDRGDAAADLAHDAGALMAEDRGEEALGVGPGEGIGIGVADAGRHHLDQHLAGLGSVEIDRLDGKWRPRLPRYRGTRLHSGSSPFARHRDD